MQIMNKKLKSISLCKLSSIVFPECIHENVNISCLMRLYFDLKSIVVFTDFRLRLTVKRLTIGAKQYFGYEFWKNNENLIQVFKLHIKF